MITEGIFSTTETNFYDLYQSNDEYILRKIEEAREKAKGYLEGKKRYKYYPIYGEDESIDGEVCYLIRLSDYEVDRIKTIIIDEYNKLLEEGIPYDTDIYELCKDVPLTEIRDNKELDNLLFSPNSKFLKKSSK